jgi:hypothetical protein
MLAGQCLFAVISLFVAGKIVDRITGESVDRSLQIVVVIVSLTALFVGFNIFKKTIYRIRAEKKSGVERIERYRKACIIWWIMIEGPGFFAIICFMWTNNLSFFFLAVFHILILLVFMPRRENIIVLLNLDSQEINQVEGRV